jgi:hypothetical protein
MKTFILDVRNELMEKRMRPLVSIMFFILIGIGIANRLPHFSNLVVHYGLQSIQLCVILK